MTQNWNKFIDHFPTTSPSAKMLVDLAEYGVIKVSGPDASKFLQGQLSCDVLKLDQGQHTLGAYCNIKGKVESLFRIWRQGEDYYLRSLRSMIEPMMKELQKYGMFSKVAIQDMTNMIPGFGLINHKLDLTTDYPELVQLQISALPRYEVFGPVQVLQTAWHDCMQHASYVDPIVWQQLEIEDKIPEIYPLTVAIFFPHDLDLPKLNAVSFTKGCYRGQEIIARMQNRGNIKRHLHAFACAENNLQPGTVITADGTEQENIAGTVVRCCIGKNGGSMGLAVVSDVYSMNSLKINNQN